MGTDKNIREIREIRGQEFPRATSIHKTLSGLCASVVKNDHRVTESTEKTRVCRTPPNEKLTDDEERAKDGRIGTLL